MAYLLHTYSVKTESALNINGRLIRLALPALDVVSNRLPLDALSNFHSTTLIVSGRWRLTLGFGLGIKFQHFARMHGQRFGEDAYIDKRYVALASFNTANVAPCKSALQG